MADRDDKETEPPDRADPPEISSEILFGNEKTVIIRHSGQTYRLQITRNDKLILQK